MLLSMSKFVLGLDYGTNSARALLVDCANGREIATAVVNYPSGEQGVIVDARDPHLARQSPADYALVLEQAVRAALQQAMDSEPDFAPGQVVGIGVDTTGSSPIPVDANNRALALDSRFRDNPNAQCWLWKDHTAHAEAAAITECAARMRPQYLARCGNTYSSEWFWSKIWHCLKVDPEVFAAAHSWVELCDYLPALLAGVESPEQVVRSVCAAGHKAMFAADWGGLPDKEFLATLDPALADLRDRLYDQAHDASACAGKLCADWALRLGLPEGIPIGVGLFDVHFGAVGCGVTPGTLVKVIGTSTCDCAILPACAQRAGKPADQPIPEIPGICGIVHGSILPEFYGVEAGQSAVGDLFKWWVEGICGGDAALHGELTRQIADYQPGQSGLLALDWNNGNRTILVDPRLSGLLLGQTLRTTPAEIYRAFLEATAFGARCILERMEAYGIEVERIVCAGGIAGKNSVLMQIYADVTGRELCLSGSDQTCALGAAIGAAVVAGVHPDFATAQQCMVHLSETRYQPNPEAAKAYEPLFELYQQLHDAFGGVSRSADLGGVMKALLDIKERMRG